MVFRVEAVVVVVRAGAVVLDHDGQGRAVRVAVAVRRDDAEVQVDDIVGVRAVSMVERTQQREGVVAGGGIDRQRKDRRAVRRAGVGVAGERDRDRMAFRGQHAAGAADGAESAVARDRAGRVGEEVGVQIARDAGRRAEIAFVHRARTGAQFRIVRVEDDRDAVGRADDRRTAGGPFRRRRTPVSGRI